MEIMGFLFLLHSSEIGREEIRPSGGTPEVGDSAALTDYSAALGMIGPWLHVRRIKNVSISIGISYLIHDHAQGDHGVVRQHVPLPQLHHHIGAYFYPSVE